MSLSRNYQFFVYYLMGPLVFLTGMVGNIIAIIILSRRSMTKLGPKNIYLYLFICDSIFLSFIIVNYFDFGYDYDLTVLSKYICKMYWYISYVIAPISPWLLIYISIDKVIAIKYPSKRFFLRNKKNQFIYLIILIAFNSVFYLPIAYYFKIHDENLNETNGTIYCDFVNSDMRQLINLMDTGNRIVLPFLLMTACSLRLLVSIIRMRIRIINNFGSNNHKRISRDIKIVFSLIFLNVVFILLNVPSAVSIYYSFSDFGFIVTSYIFYLTYGLNFYIIFLTNSVFRQEFFVLINFKCFNIQ